MTDLEIFEILKTENKKFVLQVIADHAIYFKLMTRVSTEIDQDLDNDNDENFDHEYSMCGSIAEFPYSDEGLANARQLAKEEWRRRPYIAIKIVDGDNSRGYGSYLNEIVDMEANGAPAGRNASYPGNFFGNPHY